MKLLISSIVIILIAYGALNLFLKIRSDKHSNKFIENILKRLGLSFLKTKKQGWSIKTFLWDKSIENLTTSDIPKIHWFQVKHKECSGIADPFLFIHDKVFYLFFEYEYHKHLNKGADIAYAVSKDGLKWKFKSKVLTENFHQSFPYIFSVKGDIYMLPESYESNQVRLYKATSFPNQWKLEKVLFEGKKMVDTIFIEKEGIYYWFSTDLKADTLELYYSFEFTSEWLKHPKSPLTINRKKNRNAGSIIQENGKFYRVAQDAVKGYGSGINYYEIEELSKYSYKEKAIKEPLLFKDKGNIKDAIHHLSVIKLDRNKKLIAIDGANFAVKSIG